MVKGEIKMASLSIAFLLLVAWGMPVWAQGFNPKKGLIPERRDLTFEVAQVKKRWAQMAPEERLYYSSFYLPEPLLDTRKVASAALFLQSASDSISNANIITTKHFRLIWGKNYKDYINKNSPYFILWGDPDGDGIPTFVEYLLGTDPYSFTDLTTVQNFESGIMEYVWKKVVDEWGFKPPFKSDENYIDVYIADTGVFNPSVDMNFSDKGIHLPTQVYGLTTTYQNDVPYIIINQNISESVLKVTFGHEFFHSCQISYIGFDTLLETNNIWLAESSAVWMESALFPTIDNYKQYVNYFVDYPEESLFSSSLYLNYGAVLFLKYLTEYYHEPDDEIGYKIIKWLWAENEVQKNPIVTIANFLKWQNIRPIKNLKDAYAEFALKNLDIKNSYKDGSKYDEIYIVKIDQIDSNKTTPHTFKMDAYQYMPQYYAANYIKVMIADSDQVGVANRFLGNFESLGGYWKKGDADWRVYVVFEDKAGKRSDPLLLTMEDLKKGQVYKWDTTIFKSAYLMVAALPLDETGFDPNELDYFSYQLNYNAYVATSIGAGWNLLGLGEATLGALAPFEGEIKSLWGWGGNNWKVYIPNLEEGALESYLKNYNLQKLELVGSSEAVWVNSLSHFELEMGASKGMGYTLNPGWNLIGIQSFAGFDVAEVLKGCDVKSVWKWDAPSGKWYVYLPTLLGGKEYAKNKGFGWLERLYWQDGFWVNSMGNCNIQN
jgi:hypothetical protein